MLARLRLPALVVLAILATCQATLAQRAQTAAESASQWGLLGTWRLDCNTPASSADSDLSYVVREGQLFHDREFGNARDSSVVNAATILPDGSIELVVTFASLAQTRQFSLTKGGDGRIRALSNRKVDTEEYTVRDGKFTGNGNDSPWQTAAAEPGGPRTSRTLEVAAQDGGARAAARTQCHPRRRRAPGTPSPCTRAAPASHTAPAAPP